MSTSNEMWWLYLYTLLCDCTIQYTLLKQAVSVTHARKSSRTRAPACIKSVVYGRNAENEPVSRIKMADYRALMSMGAL